MHENQPRDSSSPFPGHDRYHQLLDHLPVGVYRSTEEGWILEGNPALVAMLDLPGPAALAGANIKQFYLEVEDRERHLRELVSDPTCSSEFRFRTAAGRLIWVQDHPRAVLDGEGRVVCYDGVLIEITALKEAEEARTRLAHRLRTARERLDQLAELLPICAACKKVRDDHGYWEAVDAYFARRSHLRFSHGICPDCMVKLYPEVMARKRP